MREDPQIYLEIGIPTIFYIVQCRIKTWNQRWIIRCTNLSFSDSNMHKWIYAYSKTNKNDTARFQLIKLNYFTWNQKKGIHLQVQCTIEIYVQVIEQNLVSATQAQRSVLVNVFLFLHVPCEKLKSSGDVPNQEFYLQYL